MARHIDDDWNPEDGIDLPDDVWSDEQLQLAIRPDEDRVVELEDDEHDVYY